MSRRYLWIAAAALIAGCDDDNNDNMIPPGQTASRIVVRTDIASDQSGAIANDPTLVNAWGLAFNPDGPAWVSATESGISEVYDANGNHVIPSVVIPSPGGATSAPTGQVFNANAGAFMGDKFIFVTEDGTIAGWQPANGASAVTRVDNSARTAIYKGVTIVNAPDGTPLLFATNFHDGTVEVYNSSFAPVTTAGSFQDPNLPTGFAPFNVQFAEQGSLIVTYALQDAAKEDDVKGLGNGFVDLFDTNGVLLTRLISGGVLNSPWGVAFTPSTFAAAPSSLLIGNFGDGLIHVYSVNLASRSAASQVGTLRDANQVDLVVDGLWALVFGPDAGGFRSDTLYFTAGPSDETHGVFGRLVSGTTSTSSPSPY